MRQITILYKIRFKNKCRFYKSFFSINSTKNCYTFFIVKEVLTFIITSIILYFFYNNMSDFDLSEMTVKAIIMILIFIQSLGYNKSIHNYILANLDLYRLSSNSFINFFKRTVLLHCFVDFCFKSSSIIPIIICSYIWFPQSIFIVVLGLLIAFLVKINEVLHILTKDIKGKLSLVVSLLKSSFGLLMITVLFAISFRVIKATLNITKILLTSSTYKEAALLNDLLISFINSVNWFKTLFQNNLLLFVIYFIILILTPIIQNFRQYVYLWNNKSIKNNSSSLHITPYDKSPQRCLPFDKIIYQLKLNTVFAQIKKQPEIIVWIIIESIILYNIKNDFSKYIFILWFYFIGNSNYIRSLFVVGNKAFSNYDDNIDLYYWRLISNSTLSIYKERLKLLMEYSYKITWCQSIFACILSQIFLSDKLLVLLSIIIIFLIRKPMHFFNCKLVSFSSYFTFANVCKSRLRTSNSDETELIEDKLQNIFKLPFALIPLIIVVLNYIYSFLTIFLSFLIIFLLFMSAYLIQKQIEQYIRKAGEILEQVNVLD